jgi:hypothetical protein
LRPGHDVTDDSLGDDLASCAALEREVPRGGCISSDALSALALKGLAFDGMLSVFYCAACRGEFVGDHGRRFCDACGDERARKRDRDRKRRIRGTQLAPTSCACGCGAPITAMRATRRYASSACRQRAHRRKETT